MTVDLEQSLAELAGSVHDDGTADRMNGQVRSMVTRIRRRRATRHAVTGAVGVGAAAAVTFGGLQLARPDRVPQPPVGPATGSSQASVSPSEDPQEAARRVEQQRQEAAEAQRVTALSQLMATAAGQPTVPVFPACGSRLPDLTGAVLTLDLAVGPGPWGTLADLPGQATVRTVGGRHVIGNAPTNGAQIVLLRDGVVVGSIPATGGDVFMLDLGPDATQQLQASGGTTLCDGPGISVAQTPTGLPLGTYQAYAVMTVMLQEVTDASGNAASVSEPTLAVSQPVDITIGG
ncbi:MAG TPA: hypothetical protein VGK35_00905, partial [Actinotalea sp.]